MRQGRQFNRLVAMTVVGLLSTTAMAKAPPPAGSMKTALIQSYDARMVTLPPKTLGLDPFYRKYADAAGIPVVGSVKVPDAGILIARDIVTGMTAQRPDLRAQLIDDGARIGVMAIDETTTDLPEQRDWKKPAIDDPRLSKCDVRDYATTIGLQSDRQYWNQRARGMGGLFTTGAAENILGVPGTRYYGENILVHEFSHALFGAIREADPALASAVETAYVHAKQKALWAGSYMAINVEEYWAEGTQFWFNSNKAYITDALTIVDSDQFQARDPELYNLMATVYPASHRLAADIYYRHAERMNSAVIHLDAQGTVKDDCYS